MKSTSIILFIVLVFGKTLYGQEKAAFSIPGMGSVEANYQYSTFKQNGNRININQFGATLTMPVLNRFKSGKHDFILVGGGYSKLTLSGTDSQFGRDDFHTVSVPVTIQKALSQKYAIIMSLIPSVSSDFKDLSGEDLVYSAALMLKVNKSDRFNYSLGAFFSRQFYGTVLVPVVAVDWKPNTRLSVTGLLPVAGKIKYQKTQRSAFGAIADLNFGGSSYRLSENMNSEYFHLTQLNSAFFYEYKFSKRFSVEANIGYNFTQELNRYAKGEKVDWIPFNNANSRNPLAEIKKAGPSVKTGMKYTF